MVVPTLFRRKKIASVMLATLLMALLVSECFAAPKTEDTVLSFFPDTSFMFPLGSAVKVRWVFPPISQTRPDAHFSISSSGMPLIGYGRIDKYLVYPDKEYVIVVDMGFSDFTYLDNGVLLLANGNDIGILAKPKQMTQNKEGIPVVGFQPITSVPVSKCGVFGSIGNTAYCAGLNEKSGEYELYTLGSEKGAGLNELEKVLTAREPITAVAGDDETIFVGLGRRVVRIAQKDKSISPYYLHPSAAVNGLAYSAQSGLFISTGGELVFAGPNGAMEIMRAPKHQIIMRQGILYLFFPDSLAVLAIEHLDDLKRFNMSVRPAAGTEAKSPLEITNIRFFESGPPPYKNTQFAKNFDRPEVATRIRAVVSQIDYRGISASKGTRQHAVTVAWFEPMGGLLKSKTFTVVLRPPSASGTIYAAIGGETERGGYMPGGPKPDGLNYKFGPDALGPRYPGKYRMTVQVDGIPTGEAFFMINGTVRPFEALANNDLETLQRLLAQGLNPNEKDEKGTPLLHQAVEYSTARLVELLLKNGADPNAVDSNATPALALVFFRASEWREKADLLIRHGARVNTTWGKEGKPLVYSPAYFEEDKVCYLIEKGASIETPDPVTKETVLEKAILLSDCTDHLLSLLMKRGVSLKTWDDRGMTPLANAISLNKPECVQQLLSRGAPISAVYKDLGHPDIMHSALFLALKLYSHDEERNDSFAMVNRSQIVKMLLEKGAVLGPNGEEEIITHGSVASLVGTDIIYRCIGTDDYALTRAAKSDNSEIRQQVIRRYLEKAREGVASANDPAGLNKALENCKTARRLSEEKYKTIQVEVVAGLRPDGNSLTPYIGTGLLGRPEGGVYILSVVAGSPAERAGLKAGDIVTAVGGQQVAKEEDVDSVISSLRQVKTIQITILRDEPTDLPEIQLYCGILETEVTMRSFGFLDNYNVLMAEMDIKRWLEMNPDADVSRQIRSRSLPHIHKGFKVY